MKSTQTFILEAISKYGNKFNYDKTLYTGAHSLVTITCKLHGDFQQIASNHVRPTSKYPCKECLIELLRTPLDSFISKAKEIHNCDYTYEKVIYQGTSKNIIVTCLNHGDFKTTPSKHLRNYKCPGCRVPSKGEDKITKWLQKNDIEFTHQKTFVNLINPNTKYSLRIDFFLPKQNLAIEFDGIQHEGPFDFRSKNRTSEQANKSFADLQFRDSIKEQYLFNNNVELLRIKYKDMSKIDKILEKTIKKV